jgi:hypothetical protein
VLLSTLLHAILHPSHHLPNVLLQIANKLGLSNKKKTVPKLLLAPSPWLHNNVPGAPVLAYEKHSSEQRSAQPTEQGNKKTPWLISRTNDTDRGTTACRRSKCQLLADEGCHLASVTNPYGRISVSRPEPLPFLSSSSSVVLTRRSGPRSRLTMSQKIC